MGKERITERAHQLADLVRRATSYESTDGRECVPEVWVVGGTICICHEKHWNRSTVDLSERDAEAFLAWIAKRNKAPVFSSYFEYQKDEARRQRANGKRRQRTIASSKRAVIRESDPIRVREILAQTLAELQDAHRSIEILRKGA